MFLPPECLRMHQVVLSTAVLLGKTPKFSINSYLLLLRLCQILNSGVTITCAVFYASTLYNEEHYEVCTMKLNCEACAVCNVDCDL